MTDAPTRAGWRFTLVSPRGFLITAATLAVLFLVAHAAGLRGHASVICGQVPGGSVAIALGTAYVLSYFAWVLVVPVLVIGAGILALLNRLLPAHKPPGQREAPAP